MRAPLTGTSRRVLTFVSLAVAATFVAATASASVVDEGEWYIDLYDIEAYHDKGIDGSGVTIAVIDDAINTAVPTLKGADVTVMPDALCFDSNGKPQEPDTEDLDTAFHGTNVVMKIVGNGTGYSGAEGVTGVAPGASVLFYGLGQEDVEDCYTEGDGDVTLVEDYIGGAIVDAVDKGADIVSMSLGLGGTGDLMDAVLYAIQNDVIVVNATTNDDADMSESNAVILHNGVLGVGAFGADGNVGLDSNGNPNTGIGLDVVAPGIGVLLQGDATAWSGQWIGKGTSYATPITAANLALAMQQTPEATGNQILQLLLHNTNVDAPHEIYFDTENRQEGYGSVDTISLLSDDPLKYPDVNPLVLEGETPTPAEIYGSPSPSPSPSPSSSTSTAPAPSPSVTPTVPPTDSSGAPGWLWPVIGVLLVLAVAAGAVAVVVTSRRNKERDSS